MNRNPSFFSGLALIAVAILFAACGDGDPEQTLECGEGTAVQNGECVLVDHDCDDDEIVTPAGQCQLPELLCGDNSQYDAATGECIADFDVTCGQGTTEEDGQCVISNPTVCATGTVLADEQCVLADEACGSGTELDAPYCHPSSDVCEGPTQWDVENGKCVHTNDIECGEGTANYNDTCISQETFADGLAAQAQIAHGDGTPITPTEDSSFIFTGVLDNQLSQTFELEGQEGQWLEITIYPRGLPSPGFALSDEFGDWQREVTPGMTSTPSRIVATPQDDTYELTINTSLTDSEDASLFGDESWEYVGVVDIVDRPSPIDWDIDEENFSSALDATKENLVRIETEDTDVVVISADALGNDVRDATLEVWGTPGVYSERFEMEPHTPIAIDTSSVGVTHFHFDAREFVGPRTDFEINARPTVQLPDGEYYDHAIDAEAGEVIFVSHRSDDATTLSANIYLGGELQTAFEEVLADNRSSYTQHQTKRQFFYAPEDGTYVVEFENTSGGEVENFVSTSSSEEVPVFEVPADGSADFEAFYEFDQLLPGDWRMVVVKTQSSAFVDVLITAGAGTPRSTVFDSEHNELETATGVSGTSTPDFVASTPGIYYVVSRPWSTFTIAEESLHFELTAEVVDALDPGDIIEESFDVELFDILHGAISYGTGEAPTIRLLNPNDAVVFEVDDFSGEFDFFEMVPGNGEFTVEVENTSDEPILGIDVDVESSTPVDIVDIEGDFEETYDRDALNEWDSEYIVVRPDDDMVLDITSTFGAGESAVMRIWNAQQRTAIAEGGNIEEFNMRHHFDGQTPYVLEFRALSDLEEGYLWTIDGFEVFTVDEIREHSPPLEIASGGGEGSSSMEVSGCDEIADISISFDMPSGSAFQVHIDLLAPSQTNPITLHDASGGSLSTVYPDETEPVDSLDSLFNQDGNGFWSVDLVNDAFSIDAELASWGLHLVCAK